jgi:hypothetical protein
VSSLWNSKRVGKLHFSCSHYSERFWNLKFIFDFQIAQAEERRTSDYQLVIIAFVAALANPFKPDYNFGW